MPIYEYACKKCGHAFEHLHRTLNEAPPKCPSCGASRPAKQLSTFSTAVAGQNALPCEAAGACSTSACPTGSCPYSGN